MFRSAMQKIQEYPNCGKLAFVLAQILDSYFGIEDVRGKEQYKKEILAIYDRALESEEESDRKHMNFWSGFSFRAVRKSMFAFKDFIYWRWRKMMLQEQKN